MVYKASRALALVASGALAMLSGMFLPAYAQTAAELQLLQACGGNLAACANVAQQMRAYQAAGGDTAGMNQMLNAAAAAANAARGQTINPAAYGASSVVTPTNSVGAIAASQQYGQCVQAAGQNAAAAQACMRLLPPEWAALGAQAQNAYLANPQAGNAAVNQVMANAQAMAAGNPGAARELTPSPYGNALAAMAGQALGQMGGGNALAAQAAAANAAAANAAIRGGNYNAAAAGYGNALATQNAYVACIQAAAGNLQRAQACSQPVVQAYGGMPGVATAAAAYNPVNNANAVANAAGGYQACVMTVGVTNMAGIQACQQRFLGPGAAQGAQAGNPMFPAPPAATAPAAAPAAPYNPFAALGR